MRDFFKRSGASDTAEGAQDEQFSLLVTARDNAEAAFFESVLRGEGVPYVTRPHSRESWNRVMMGFDLGGVDFFVPESMLDRAAEMLAPADAAEPEDSKDGE